MSSKKFSSSSSSLPPTDFALLFSLLFISTTLTSFSGASLISRNLLQSQGSNPEPSAETNDTQIAASSTKGGEETFIEYCKGTCSPSYLFSLPDSACEKDCLECVSSSNSSSLSEGAGENEACDSVFTPHFSLFTYAYTGHDCEVSSPCSVSPDGTASHAFPSNSSALSSSGSFRSSAPLKLFFTISIILLYAIILGGLVMLTYFCCCSPRRRGKAVISLYVRMGEEGGMMEDTGGCIKRTLSDDSTSSLSFSRNQSSRERASGLKVRRSDDLDVESPRKCLEFGRYGSPGFGAYTHISTAENRRQQGAENRAMEQHEFVGVDFLGSVGDEGGESGEEGQRSIPRVMTPLPREKPNVQRM